MRAYFKRINWINHEIKQSENKVHKAPSLDYRTYYLCCILRNIQFVLPNTKGKHSLYIFSSYNSGGFCRLSWRPSCASWGYLSSTWTCQDTTHLATFSCCPPIFHSKSRTGTGLNSKERVLSCIYPDLRCLNIGSRSLFSLSCSLKRAFRNLVFPRKWPRLVFDATMEYRLFANGNI